MILLLFNCNKMVVEQQKNPEVNEEQKDLAKFEGDLNKAKNPAAAEKIVKDCIDSGKA